MLFDQQKLLKAIDVEMRDLRNASPADTAEMITVPWNSKRS